MGVVRAGHVASAAVSIPTTAATALNAARVARSSLQVQNLDAANPIYVGDSTVTSSTGLKVSAGQTESFDDFIGILYARSTGGSCDVRVLEVY